jgi:hypothetical protein
MSDHYAEEAIARSATSLVEWFELELTMPKKHSEDSPTVSQSAAAAAPARAAKPVRAKSSRTKKAEARAPAVQQPMSEQEEIARLAYSYWEARGRQGGSSEEDWLRAEQEVRSRLRAAGS